MDAETSLSFVTHSVLHVECLPHLTCHIRPTKIDESSKLKALIEEVEAVMVSLTWVTKHFERFTTRFR